jgi:hypothetical protein
LDPRCSFSRNQVMARAEPWPLTMLTVMLKRLKLLVMNRNFADGL